MLSRSLVVSSEFTDNVDFARTATQEDFLFTLTPGLRYQSRGERTTLGAEASADFELHAERREANEIRQRYQLSGQRRVSDHLGASVSAVYQEDPTTVTEPGVSRVVVRAVRRTYGPDASVALQLGERSSLALSYGFRRTAYDSERYVDADAHTAQATLDRAVDEKGSKVFFRPQYARNSSSTNRTSNYGAALGWAPRMTESLSFSIAVGGQYTVVDPSGVSPTGGRGRRTGRNAFLDASLERRWEKSSLQAALGRSAAYSAEGDAVETDSVSAGFNRKFSEFWSGRLAASYRRSRDLGGSTRQATSYWELAPSLSWRFAEHHDLALSYSHASRTDRAASTDREAVRNRVSAAARFNFPKHW